MSLALSIIGWTFFAFGIVAGLLLNLVGLFGNWVILGTVATAWIIMRFEHFGLWTLLLLAALATLGEILELLAAGYGAKRFGGGRGAAVAALAGCIIGGIAGTPWFPLAGTLAGAVAGAFLGAILFEMLVSNKPVRASARTGVGAALGRVGGMFAKLMIGFAMLLAAARGY
ncbi:MAG TPA: DUF456 domain-containing protein [Candidatus Hydrogenedentes bacterium]|nr:DUF456 domain-containing protein [Candidatus Hydrogenedentota bacterium]